MAKSKITPSKVSKYGVNIAKDGVLRNACDILSQKSVNMDKIRQIWPEIPYVSREIDEQIEINSHYRVILRNKKLIFWHLKGMKILLFQIISIMISFQVFQTR